MNRQAGNPLSPSFLIEVMALELVDPPFGRYPGEIRFFLASMIDHHLHPDWADPEGLGDDVSVEERDTALRAVLGWQATAEKAVRQQDQGAEHAAVETRRELFGDRMPRP